MLSGFRSQNLLRIAQTRPKSSPSRRNASTSGLNNVKDQKKIVIIGGVAGGATAAARARRLAEHSKIVMLERGPDVSFANCGMPYYISGEIKDRSKLAVQTPKSLSEVLGIEVRTHTEAVAIDPKSKTVKVIDRTNNSEETISYDKLILAPGASPLKPPIPGIDSVASHVFSLRSLKDMDRVFSRVGTTPKPRHAVVVGAGYIGLEMVEALVSRGLKVTLVEAQPQVLPHLDAEMAVPLLEEMKLRGVQVHVATSVTALRASANVAVGAVEVQTSASENWLTADFIIMAAGVKPESHLASNAGLTIGGNNKAIVVNEHMQTSDPDIYAVGDAVLVKDGVEPAMSTWAPLAGPANRQARLAVDHIFLQSNTSLAPEGYRGSLGTAIVRVFDVVAAATGWNEKMLRAKGKPQSLYQSAVVVGHNHASYYPHSTNLTVKVVWETGSGRLLGAQVTGVDGVDKRIDILATAIAGRMKIDDLAHLELSYAPPFGSARDVINTIGFLGQNIRRGLVRPLGDMPVSRSGSSAPLILDVRAEAVAQLHPIPDAINIPLEQIRSRIDEIEQLAPSGRDIVTVCNVGKSSYFASRILAQHGFNVFSLLGGATLLSAKNSASSLGAHVAAVARDEAPSTLNATSVSQETPAVELDACGLACPGPILEMHKMLPKLAEGQHLIVKASDPGFANDFPAFIKMHSAQVELVGSGVQRDKGIFTGRLMKKSNSTTSTGSTPVNDASTRSTSSNEDEKAKNASIIVFSSEMDKVLAALVIANGIVASGGQATLFFTFWGLTALRKERGSSPPAGDKSFLDSAFGAMLPHGFNSLGLSHMNFGGIGAKLMKHTMHKKHLPELDGLIKSAVDSGKVRFVACTMSMEALGIRQTELIDHVELGGVADFLANARNSGTTLFI